MMTLIKIESTSPNSYCLKPMSIAASRTSVTALMENPYSPKYKYDTRQSNAHPDTKAAEKPAMNNTYSAANAW